MPGNPPHRKPESDALLLESPRIRLSNNETHALEDLLQKTLRYGTEDRMPVESMIDHRWLVEDLELATEKERAGDRWIFE